VVSHRQVVLRHSPLSPPAPIPGLVSSSFGPLVNLVPITDEDVGLGALNPNRLFQTQQEEQAHPASAPLQTQPECPSLGAADVGDQKPAEGSVVTTGQSSRHQLQSQTLNTLKSRYYNRLSEITIGKSKEKIMLYKSRYNSHIIEITKRKSLGRRYGTSIKNMG